MRPSSSAKRADIAGLASIRTFEGIAIDGSASDFADPVIMQICQEQIPLAYLLLLLSDKEKPTDWTTT